jgi:hypothetical protein
VKLSSDSLVGQRMPISFDVELQDSLVDGSIEILRAHVRELVEQRCGDKVHEPSSG